ncbi:dolichyl-P-Man:Man(5)GlcNAc(2)-PP-dolichol alpha-1,3-mannosyltransferase [Coemansia sp. RSA 1933]|nr:dolichyl-P-Man:Man(5)GlcNAc(2)-PP-dolichol alpha-1,3-mannosyltransferase [Coemansia sp. RSA 1933]
MTVPRQKRIMFLMALVAAEVALTAAIIQRVAYTEIDWRAYMQEVSGAIGGERNYALLAGDTGPLVYPAGFVWIFGALQLISDGGMDIRLVQYVFMALYLITLITVLAIYSRAQSVARVHPSMLVLLALSRRLHSIYVLRLFNDGVAMLFAYLAVLALTLAPKYSSRWWSISTLLLSAGISVKMSVQLMVPGFGFIWLRGGGIALAAKQTVLLLASQALVAAPFLLHYPREYVARAFDYGRQFDFTWTVNWRFLGPHAFASPLWARILLASHMALLAVLALTVWPRLSRSSVRDMVTSWFRRTQQRPAISADEIIAVVFSANFMGIVCARSLHYQFYAWYAHTLPLLLHIARIPLLVQPVLWLAIECAWNIYPSTTTSSLVLLIAHLVLLAAILINGTRKKDTCHS